MTDKTILISKIPENCQQCKLKSRVQGVLGISHCCNLVEEMIPLEKGFEQRLPNCPLVSVEEHDKKIRDKVIEEFVELLMIRCEESSCNTLFNGLPVDILTLDNTIDEIREIAEQMKEVRE